MDSFARKAAEDRPVFINEPASRRDVSAIIIEKDFWMCWTLRRLTEHADLAPHLTFKGGTSLSKAYGIIERFSEDIDLTVGHDAPCVRDTASPMEAGISKNEVGRRAEALKLAAQAYVRNVALPAITGVVATALGTHDGWRVVLDGEDPDAQTILFHNPNLLKYECVYLHAFEAGSEARPGTGGWIDFFNRHRPRSTLGGQTPNEVCLGSELRRQAA